MSEMRAFPFGGVPVYNPQSLSKGEALAQFHARQALYDTLLNLLREQRPSHVLLIGTRGMGKTTLLQRVRYGVEDDAELSGRYLILAFPEEQYNVNRLHHFLLNTVDALADAMERLRDPQMLARIEAYGERIGSRGQEEIEREVPRFLGEIAQEMGRGILLLIDNADRLFETIEQREQWALRELLSSRRDLTFFGATTQASDGIYAPDRAFFEFFKIYTLRALSLEEVRELLLRLSESVDEIKGEEGSARRRVEEWLAADAARLRTLVQVTGGNPRTTVLLFHLVLDGLSGGAREYLEQLLDQCTPNYKGRVDDLPAQAQQVLHAVALRWDPTTAMEVAEDTGLETNAVSTHLTRLVRQGILEKADPGDSKKALYQIAERFFNIWYLMRASRRIRAKLRWFIEFLRVFFESRELEQMAWERLERFHIAGRRGRAEIETAFAYFVASGADRKRFEDYLRRECADMEPEWREYVDRSEDWAPAEQTALSNVPEKEAALREATEREPGNAENWSRLGRFLVRNADSKEEAEAALRKAIELDPEEGWFWNNLGVSLSSVPERLGEAEAAYRKAIELEPNLAGAWSNLGNLLRNIPKRRDEAEAALRKATEIEPDDARFWNSLGIVLDKIPERRSEAEAALRKATELEPDEARFWNNLGVVLDKIPERRSEAEAALRKATELEPDDARFWNNLGIVLALQANRQREAEAALRRSVELAPSRMNLSNLGVLLYCEMRNEREAMGYFRRAYELDPESSVTAAIIAACEPEAQKEQILSLRAAWSGVDLWDGLPGMCRNYPPFGKILLKICDLVQKHDRSNKFAPLHRAVALAAIGDFPRASVALEDALVGDPIELLSMGRNALETFFAAAVKRGRVRECIELLDKKELKDAWRPYYEALRAVEEGSSAYLKRVAVEIREPAMLILQQIAQELPGVPDA